MTRVVVFGGQTFADEARAYRVLDAVHAARPIAVVIEGGAPGGDRFGRNWALARGIAVETYEAEWSDVDRPGAKLRRRQNGDWYDALAGFVRNQKMIDVGRPDLGVAFPGNNGTADMLRRMRRARIKVIEG